MIVVYIYYFLRFRVISAHKSAHVKIGPEPFRPINYFKTGIVHNTAYCIDDIEN